MSDSHMAFSIINILNTKYTKYVGCDNIDVEHLVNICSLYKNKDNTPATIIKVPMPTFTKDIEIAGTQREILESDEFTKKYSYFVNIIYACLVTDVDIFEENATGVTMKNIYKIRRSIKIEYKKNVQEMSRTTMKLLQDLQVEDYLDIVNGFTNKITVMNNMLTSLNKIITVGNYSNSDNLFVLILPYFYKYTEYIEIYG
jgi:hypothetical protein